jgi:hypothetical protein
MLEATGIDNRGFKQSKSLAQCEHDPCTKDYVDDSNDATSPFTPFQPAQGGSFGGYDAAVFYIKNSVYWTGNKVSAWIQMDMQLI